MHRLTGARLSKIAHVRKWATPKFKRDQWGWQGASTKRAGEGATMQSIIL
jgi:hypothetical protein